MKNPEQECIEDFKKQFFSQPFGTITKRELELKILQYALNHKLIEPTPHNLAKELKTTMTKAHTYLTDLALRDDTIDDDSALYSLIVLLKDAEVISTDSYLQFPLQDAKLRLWLEQQLSQYNLLQGESIRKDIVKITPKAIAVLLEKHNKLPSQSQIKEQFKDTSWYKKMNKSNKSSIDWLSHINISAEAMKNIAEFISLLGN